MQLLNTLPVLAVCDNITAVPQPTLDAIGILRTASEATVRVTSPGWAILQRASARLEAELSEHVPNWSQLGQST